jgi:hypothetical protein
MREAARDPQYSVPALPIPLTSGDPMRYPSPVLLAAVLGTLVLSPSADAQAPSDAGAWSACQSYVKKRLWDPANLRFPALGSESVQIQMVPGAPRRRYEIRSYVQLPDASGSEETLPFTCTVEYGTTSLNLPSGYVWRRLELPDTTVRLPSDVRRNRNAPSAARGSRRA